MSEQQSGDTGLNPRQQEAADHIFGPLLILAGAGSGKTRVLTHRVAHLIASGEASPQQILAVTFTNKAAREMESRILARLGQMGIPVLDKMWISTFHSICARILREDIHRLGYQPFFAIYDDSDQLSMVKKCLALLEINDKIHPAKSFQAKINECKRLALTPEAVAQKSTQFMDQMSLKVYQLYEDQMHKANALDFGDLLFKTFLLFQSAPEVLETYQQKFLFVMVDEYQDTNHIQYCILQQLVRNHRNFCVVGDEDQSIYSWRGADISNILDFEKDFPEAKVVKLEENYRSSSNIVSAASAVIRNNSQRKDKTLFTQNSGGELITLREEMNEYEEARFVVKKIEDHLTEGEHNREDIAIFYRTNAQSRVIEDLLRSHSIPYRIVGGMKFYERLEIKDMLGYLKALLNPADEIAFKRIINTPARGIGKTTVEKIEEVAQEEGLIFFDAIERTAERRLVHSGAAKKIRAFHQLMQKLKSEMTQLSLSELYIRVLDETGYVLKLKAEDSPEAQARIENLEEFDNAIRQFEQERGEEATLQTFLEEMALVSDVDQMQEGENQVTLMTLHISKGLEFPIVFMVGMEEGLFPSGRSFDATQPEAMEEERRLCYVGMTRAREKLYMTCAKNRRVWGQDQSHSPSRFLIEIPEEYLDRQLGQKRPRFYADTVGKPSLSNPSKRSWETSYDEVPAYEDYGDQMPGSGAGLQKGMRVRHPTFGVGSIFSVEGQGDTQKVSVLFSNRELKKFVTKYARLELLN